jgi:hypothetical protein
MAMSISVIHAGQVASALVIASSVKVEPPSRPSEIVAVDLLVRLMTRFFTTGSQGAG